MLALTVLVFALGIAFPVKQAIDNANNVTTNTPHNYTLPNGTVTTGNITTIGMDCNNESISTFNKGACIVSDLSMFYFIGGLIFLAGTIIAARVLL